jgi:hypothetical protein
MRNLLFLFSLIFLCISCSEATRRNIGRNYLPEKAMGAFKKELDKASPEFRRGWYDGCEAGTAVSSVNTFYQMFYVNNRVDGYAKANNADYRTAWGDALWYCMRYEEIKQGSSLWSAMFGGYR